MAPLSISLRGIAKAFGPVQAVDGLDLDVPEGSCVGLLGPNGAGKSTTMKMLTAQAIPDRGEIEVRSEEHTSELQSRQYLVCRLLLEKKEPSRIRVVRLPQPG